MSGLSIYLHWPFCISKCPYCSFNSTPSRNEELYEEFGDYLLTDLKNSIEKIDVKNIKSIFFGGGTPSLMSAKTTAKILNFLFKNYRIENSAEISLEANPATFDNGKMQDFKQAGINRLSLGIQSFSDKNLQFLGRIYDSKQAFCATEIVSKIFKNFSLDFMYGYCGQNLKDLETDLQNAVNFDCKHISCYQLTFEKNTPFYKSLLAKEIKKISENKEIEFYNFIETFLRKRNLFRYEISNYALSGFESRHNLSYWNYDDYLGVGAGAHSRITANGKKHEIIKITEPFLWAKNLTNGSIASEKQLTEKEELEEMIIMGLRLNDGIEIKKIYSNTNKALTDKLAKKALFLQEKKLIRFQNGRLQLTESGRLKTDSIAEFLLDDI